MSIDNDFEFNACEICGKNEWVLIYDGHIRDGTFCSEKSRGVIAECSGCKVHRMNEIFCLTEKAYEVADYRSKLKQGLDSKAYFKDHDSSQSPTLNILTRLSLRGKIIADIGCGGGSLLDHISGVVSEAIAVEPYGVYRLGLKERYKHVYPYVEEAVPCWQDKVDLAVSIQVIEHVANPKTFLEGIKPLLKIGGQLLISTPNRNDILMKLLPTDFPQFFYRIVHRWYFDACSLSACAVKAGYLVESVHHTHRYGMGNALRWLRDKRPTGRIPMDGITESADGLWKSYLGQTSQADTIYLLLKRVE